MTSTPDIDALTRDAFLGGRLTICQPVKGYRAGIDPVLLAAAIPARPGQKVLELGCGAGVALLCLARRVPGLDLTGVELQSDYANLARQNAQENGIRALIYDADIATLPGEVRQRQFDHVFANPPYYDRGRGTAAPNPARDIALGERTPLSTWVETAAKRLAPRGMLSIIQRADRLPDLLSALDGYLGSPVLRPIQPRRDDPAHLIIVHASKDGRAPFEMHAPIVLHPGPSASEPSKNYTAAIDAVLRDAAELASPNTI